MKKAVCFGEIMGRLNPEGFLRLTQAQKLEFSFAGGEANVAVSLANYGIQSSFVTKLPRNDLAKAVIKTLRSYDVDISDMVWGGDRIGLYFVEKGASQRPSKVIYDRRHSSISEAKVQDFDWDAILKDADWFHFTGITPALSDNLAAICLEACRCAKSKGVTVSCDLNYRANLWDGEKASREMEGLMRYVDVCIANEEDADKVFGIKAKSSDITGGKLDHDGYVSVAEQLFEKFGFSKIAITLRGSISASDNTWSAMLYTDGKGWFSKEYLIHIVDRVGGGDSFAGALIYALLSYPDNDQQQMIDFAVAASCLKHTIEFDFNQVTLDEIERLIKGDGSGRVLR